MERKLKELLQLQMKSALTMIEEELSSIRSEQDSINT
jgi:hypothetical protein